MGAPEVTSFGISMVTASGRASSSSRVKLRRFSAPASTSTAGSAKAQDQSTYRPSTPSNKAHR
jgi:hypothetical protein